MGGHDSQKLLPWRGMHSPPGRSKPPAHYQHSNSPDRRSRPSPVGPPHFGLTYFPDK